MARARTLSFALAAIGLIAAAGARTGGGGRQGVKTRVKIRFTDANGSALFVAGCVQSPDQACERRGRVKVIGVPSRPGKNLGARLGEM